MARKRRRKRKADLVKVKLDFRVTKATAERFRQAAAEDDRTLSDYLRRLLEQALAPRKPRKDETMARIEDRYLGDGVYASFDGYHIMLDLRGQDNTTRIALTPDVLDALSRFRADVVASDNDVAEEHPPCPTPNP